MTQRISAYETGPATTYYLECDRVSQDINGNYTTVHIYIGATNGPGGTTGSYYGGIGTQYGGIDGYGMPAVHGPATPFLPSGYANGAGRWRDGPYAINIGHNADGTGPSGGVTLRMQTRYSGHDRDWVVNFNDFPTIPRASTPTLSVNPVDAGTATTITTNRASSGFTHDIYYSFGSIGWTGIAGGVGASTSWTPPLSLLNEIPNSPTGIGQILCYTKSGSTVIGSSIINFTLNTPSSVIPTWTSVSVSEAVSDVSTYVGAYVQNVSKLNYAISGAAGVYGSTISLRRFSAAGQTVDGASGTTPNPIASSGSVPVTWLVQDSRGKQKTQTSNITVLPYVKPAITTCTIQRALSDGTPDPDDGTYIRVDLNAAVQSLMNTTQRNVIQIKVRTRLSGSTTPWTDASTLKATLNPGGITYNSFTTVAGPYAVDSSYEVRVEVLDRFNLSAYQNTVSVGAVFMHWDEVGLGVGKYRENGMLDVNGDIYTNAQKVWDHADAWGRKALLPAGYRGESNPTLKRLSDSSTMANTPWVGKYDPQGSRVVVTARTSAGFVISGQSQEEGYGRWIRIPLSGNWQSYGEEVGENAWSEPSAVKLSSGIVQLSGLIRGGTITAGTTIATLPVGYRPDTSMVFLTSNGDVPRAIKVTSAGLVQVEGSNWTNTYVSLNQISFPAAGVATWTAVGSGGSSFQNSWVAYNTGTWGTPAYWKDPYGFVWFRGLISSGSTAADNTLMINLPATHRADLFQHIPVVAASAFGVIGAASNGGLAWKTNTSSTWISLCGVTIRTSDAVSGNVWYEAGVTGTYDAPLLNGWTYTGSFTVPSFTQREDGLCVSQGLLRSGTVGSFAQRVSLELTPTRSLLFMSAANYATARYDVKGIMEINQYPGRLVPQAGSNTWFSQDNLKWVGGGI